MAKFPRFLALPIAAVMLISACSGGATPAVPPASGPAATSGSSTGTAPSTGPEGSATAGGTITVTSLWGGAEQENFQKVLDAFKAKTGITAKYESNRDNYATVLQTKITGGNPPDVAILPGIGFLRRFAKDGSIKKISDLGIDAAALQPNYAPGILDIGSVDGELYAIMVKFNSKSTFWYRPAKLKDAGVDTPKDWDAFTAALKTLKDKGDKPMALGAKDDWTLTDWFENIYVRQAGPEAYDKLFSADGDWTDPSVAAAVKSMTDVINDDYVDGGIKAALGRAFTDALGQAFSATGTSDMY